MNAAAVGKTSLLTALTLDVSPRAKTFPLPFFPLDSFVLSQKGAEGVVQEDATIRYHKKIIHNPDDAHVHTSQFPLPPNKQDPRS